ncbi:MAG: YegS/Rv2252/BmrU family lipid kinase [Ruminococcaceae bacterium]|nr:YegS/Rv2252/BmrU family lipid kinase [Oscillospiraceae bacterium]
MKGLAIINPSSGKQMVQKNALDAISMMLSKGVAKEIHLFYTQKKNDGKNRVAEIRKGEYDFVMAVGGDGTVNEVVNGLVNSGTKTPLVIVGAGTINDYATAMAIPKKPVHICEMVKNMNTVLSDVGKINDNYFLNVAAGGILSEVAHNVSSDLKTSFGKMAYYFAGLKDLTSLKLDTTPLKFELDDGITFVEDVFCFVIANTSSVGGFARITPKAKINDGKLDLCILKKIDPLEMLPAALKIQTGTHIDSPWISYYQSSNIKVSPASDVTKSFPVDFDGENGGILPICVETCNQAIKLVVPNENLRLVMKETAASEEENFVDSVFYNK